MANRLLWVEESSVVEGTGREWKVYLECVSKLAALVVAEKAVGKHIAGYKLTGVYMDFSESRRSCEIELCFTRVNPKKPRLEWKEMRDLFADELAAARDTRAAAPSPKDDARPEEPSSNPT